LNNTTSTLTDLDRDYLNALADGELNSEETQQWQQRIKSDPGAARAYDEILSVKQNLGLLSIETISGQGHHRTPAATLSSARKWAVSAVAASIVCMLFIGGAYFWMNNRMTPEPEGIFAWHEMLSEKEYVVEEHGGPLFVSLDQTTDIPVPDLKPSKLYLVDAKVLGNDETKKHAVLHYRGLQGCRLTIWYGPVKSESSKMKADPRPVNLRRWSVASMDFRIIATGMDPLRFEAIADYVEFVTRQSEDDGQRTRTAMSDAYQSARSCT
jgi:hypothetical protein